MSEEEASAIITEVGKVPAFLDSLESTEDLWDLTKKELVLIGNHLRLDFSISEKKKVMIKAISSRIDGKASPTVDSIDHLSLQLRLREAA